MDQVHNHASGWTPPGFLLDEIARLETDLALLNGRRDPTPPSGLARADNKQSTPTQRASHARRLLAAGDHAGARQSASGVTASPEHATVGDRVAQVEAWIVLAQCAAISQLRHDALTALETAVEVARPHHLIRPFLISSPGVATLMQALADGRSGSSDTFSAGLVARLSAHGPLGPEPPPLRERLTERELAILAELPTMKSNSEIADEFYVSINTVKAHLKSLYRKLGVTSRRTAVRRARELNLLR